jgi:hypothetical protein
MVTKMAQNPVEKPSAPQTAYMRSVELFQELKNTNKKITVKL